MKTMLEGGAVTVAATATAGCVVGEVAAPDLSNATWELRASQLEEASVTLYTAAVPGMWAGKEGTHVPQITLEPDGSITVSCTHGLAPEHWITTLFARDQAGRVIQLVEYPGRGPGASSARMTFRPPATTVEITAYAYCNLHDLWASVPVPVA